jgi:NAD/NADP transhydrogenase beta subunit
VNPVFAGVDNEPYYLDRALMLLGEAKSFVGELVKEVQAQVGQNAA